MPITAITTAEGTTNLHLSGFNIHSTDRELPLKVAAKRASTVDNCTWLEVGDLVTFFLTPTQMKTLGIDIIAAAILLEEGESE